MTSAEVFREIELKYAIPSTRKKEITAFLASLSRKGRIKVQATREATHEDTYFDSHAFDLARHYCSVRVRRNASKKKTLTFKRIRVHTSAALADRLEVGGKYGRATLARITRHAPWLLMLNQPAKARTQQPSGYRALTELGLQPQFTVHNRRKVYTLTYRGTLQVDLCLDRVKAAVESRATAFMELEAEMVGGDAALLPEFDRYLRERMPWLRSSRAAKYERVLRSLKIWKRNRALKAEDLKQWQKRLTKVYGKFNAGYRRTLRFKDVEDLHGCRVALRQLLTMLSVLDDDRKRPVELQLLVRALKKIQRTLGRLRDWDVYMIYASVDPVLQFDSPELQKEFMHVLELERDRKRLEATVRLPKYYNAGLKKAWTACMNRRLSGLVRRVHTEHQFARLMQEFEGAYDELRRVRAQLGPADPASIRQLHRTRILAKKVRYTCQHLSFALPGDTGRLVNGFIELQDSMGEINDLFHFISHTNGIATQFEELLGPALKPRIALMQEELDAKLADFEIGSLEEILAVESKAS